jgi:hypothetical protein
LFVAKKKRVFSVIDQGENKRLLAEVLQDINGARGAPFAQGSFHVTAEVGGNAIFDGSVECVITADEREGKISIYWEEAGLEDYRSRGLYGQASTNYQLLKKDPGGVLRISDQDETYRISISYKART